MDSVFYEYLQGDERAEFIAEAKLDNEFAMLEAREKLIDLRHEQLVRDIYLKVYAENGTQEDIEKLIAEADEVKNEELGKVEEKKTGLLQSIVTGIKNIWAKIKGAIQSFFTDKSKEIPDDKEVEVDTGLVEGYGKVNQLSAIIDKAKAEFASHPIKSVLTILGVIAAGGFVIKLTGKTVKKKFGEIKGWLNKTKDVGDKTEKLAEDMGNSKETADAKEGLGLINKATGFFRSFTNAIHNIGTHATEGDLVKKAETKAEKGQLKKEFTHKGKTYYALIDKATGQPVKYFDKDDRAITFNKIPKELNGVIGEIKSGIEEKAKKNVSNIKEFIPALKELSIDGKSFGGYKFSANGLPLDSSGKEMDLSSLNDDNVAKMIRAIISPNVLKKIAGKAPEFSADQIAELVKYAKENNTVDPTSLANAISKHFNESEEDYELSIEESIFGESTEEILEVERNNLIAAFDAIM